MIRNDYSKLKIAELSFVVTSYLNSATDSKFNRKKI